MNTENRNRSQEASPTGELVGIVVRRLVPRLLLGLRHLAILAIVTIILLLSFKYVIIPSARPWWHGWLGWTVVWLAIDGIYPLRRPRNDLAQTRRAGD